MKGKKKRNKESIIEGRLGACSGNGESQSPAQNIGEFYM